MLAEASKRGRGEIPLPSLWDSGIYHLTNKNADYAKKLAQQIGNIIHTTEVIVRDSPGMLTSTKGLSFHTDHHKADWIIWYCHKQTSEGGESILVDGIKVFDSLPNNEKNSLERVRLFEHKIFEDDKESQAFIEDSGADKKMYYSFWEQEPVTENEKDALELFETSLHNAQHTRILLQPGDILAIDNRRILHGRTPITGTKDRHLTRHWINTNP